MVLNTHAVQSLKIIVEKLDADMFAKLDMAQKTL